MMKKIQQLSTSVKALLAIGGISVLAGGGDILAEAIQNEVAKKNIIVGGAGHTTETLRNVHCKIGRAHV